MGVTIGVNLNINWTKVYEWTTWNDVSTFEYDIDNSNTISGFTKILYIFKIDEYSVWIEMDDFTGGQINRIGVPLSWTYDVAVTNMIVKFKKGEFPDALTSTIYNRFQGVNGKINFWPSNYSTSPSANYDENDSGFSTGDGYGSMQFFDTDASPVECIFAWNRWGSGNLTDWGMGSRSTSHMDWTFRGNGGNFDNQLGKIYVR